jgi:hypothetical protein
MKTTICSFENRVTEAEFVELVSTVRTYSRETCVREIPREDGLEFVESKDDGTGLVVGLVVYGGPKEWYVDRAAVATAAARFPTSLAVDAVGRTRRRRGEKKV